MAAAETLLLNVGQVAEVLNVSPRLVQTLIFHGQLPSISVGRCRRVVVAELEAFVAQRRNQNDRNQGQVAVVGGGRARGRPAAQV
ncbi:MAG: helix-turn-helix domain-containing protein [Chloroflexi bacterium]|nr:MAG: helix-turn-helix domain-containing protein [Chloroflexota bacterium]